MKTPDTTDTSAPATPLSRSSPARSQAAYQELLTLVEHGRVTIRHDHNGGLYPAPACNSDQSISPYGDEWLRVQGLWLNCFELVFDAVAHGELAPEQGWFLPSTAGLYTERKQRRKLRSWQKPVHRKACTWIRPRLPELRASGWTLRRLFGIGFGPPLFMTGGIAWLSVWAKAEEVALEPNGAVRFKIAEPLRAVYQRTYPPGFKHSIPY